MFTTLFFITTSFFGTFAVAGLAIKAVMCFYKAFKTTKITHHKIYIP